jgi:hypothetical protein
VFFELITDHSAGHWTAGQTKGKYFEANSQSIGLKKMTSLLLVSFTRIGIGEQSLAILPLLVE